MSSTKIPKKCVGGLLNFVDVIMDAILVAYFFQKKECISSNVEDFVQASNSSSDAREIRHIDLNYQTYGFIALRKGYFGPHRDQIFFSQVFSVNFYTNVIVQMWTV